MAAPEGNKYAEGNNGGHPTLYRPEYSEQAYKLCLLGSTDAELADFFNVTEQTINNWKNAHQEFFESIKKGKDVADAEVASKLFHRATGYTHQETKLFLVDGEILEHEAPKHYPPDPTSAIFWLKNRQPKKWRDKQEHDHTTNGESFNLHQTLKNFMTDEGNS